MVRAEIFIEKPIEEVWQFIEMEFAKVFKCSPKQLLDKSIETKTHTFSGHEIAIKQRISKLEPNVRLEMESENTKDFVVTGYELTADSEGTFLATYEEGEGKESKIRSLNYKFMALPFLKNGSKKRLMRRLESMKYLIEGSGVENIEEGEIEL